MRILEESPAYIEYSQVTQIESEAEIKEAAADLGVKTDFYQKIQESLMADCNRYLRINIILVEDNPEKIDEAFRNFHYWNEARHQYKMNNTINREPGEDKKEASYRQFSEELNHYKAANVIAPNQDESLMQASCRQFLEWKSQQQSNGRNR